MKTSTLICIRSLCLFFLLICLPAFVHAQEGLQIADLFNKYGEQKGRDQGRAERKHPEILPHDYLQEPCVQECIPPIAGKFSRPLYTTSKTTQRRRRR